jgi:pyrroline-5-carboxylate reductase
MQLAAIGTGKLGGAILRGWLRAGLVAPQEIALPERASGSALAAELGARVAGSNAQTVEGADILLLAVKPYQLNAVLTQVRPALTPECLVISVAAGVSTSTLEAVLAPGQPVLRVLPNTPAQLGAAASAFCRGAFATEVHAQQVSQLFSALGLCLEVAESQMDAVVGVAASGVAFVYLFLEALTDGGVRMGLPRPVARQLAAQTLIGAGRMALETGQHPMELKDAVTTPAGTTMAGIAVLESAAFRGIVMEAVRASTERSAELGKPKT